MYLNTTYPLNSIKVGLHLNIMPKCIHGPIFGPIGCPWSKIWLNINHLKTIAILGYVAFLGYIKCNNYGC